MAGRYQVLHGSACPSTATIWQRRTGIRRFSKTIQPLEESTQRHPASSSTSSSVTRRVGRVRKVVQRHPQRHSQRHSQRHPLLYTSAVESHLLAISQEISRPRQLSESTSRISFWEGNIVGLLDHREISAQSRQIQSDAELSPRRDVGSSSRDVIIIVA